jgi:hypothetical protein
VPFPTFLLLALAIGVAAALAAAERLRFNPRPVLLSGSFAVFAMFLGLLFVPVSAYFYIFHGDWFLLYLVDVQKIPSALALLFFVLEACMGVLGYLMGAALARSQNMATGAAIAGVCLAASVGVLFAFPGRLSVVGSYAQYHGDFGLASYTASAVVQGAVPMGGLLLAGTAFLLIRLRVKRKNRV